jgi:mono/diheme cytochrome c family protein
MTMTCRFTATAGFCGAVLLALAALGYTPAAQTVAPRDVGPQLPPLVIHSLTGKDSFEFYCASCHGRDGAGDGPMVGRLKTRPPDLRFLSHKYDGSFDRERVLRFIAEGDHGPEHRATDMLAWGPVLQGLERSDKLVAIRIANIVDYIASLQVASRAGDQEKR